MFAQAAVPSPLSLTRPAGSRAGTSGKSFAASLIDTHEPQTVIYGPNAEIYAQGGPANALYQVEFGTVRLYRLLADGRRQISAFHVANEFFGFEADGAHHFFAEAVSRCSIRVFPRSIESDLAHAMLPVALQALARAQKHLIVIGRQCASERVAAFLLDMMERQGNAPQIELAMSRTDIADYLGLTIETVSRAFSKFKECGHIRMQSARAVYIANPEALRALCS